MDTKRLISISLESLVLLLLVAAPVYGLLQSVATAQEVTQQEVVLPLESSEKSSTPLPEKIYLEVPFLVQAPFANWDDLHENACEETSLIMLRHYLDGTTIASQAEGDREIKELIAFETAEGFPQSITLDELRRIAKSYYSLHPRVEMDITVGDVKRELASGKPVIVPAAGKILPNPHFRNGGPIYHMLVIKGYDEQGFITNDPGIAQGKDFRYTLEALYKAIHDWNKEDIYSGQKAYIVFD